MKFLNLKNNFSLGAESFDRRVRLVIFKDGEEYVCRKEFYYRLERFLNSDEKVIFKGNLQLHKNRNELNIIVRKESTGMLSIDKFRNFLQNNRESV